MMMVQHQWNMNFERNKTMLLISNRIISFKSKAHGVFDRPFFKGKDNNDKNWRLKYQWKWIGRRDRKIWSLLDNFLSNSCLWVTALCLHCVGRYIVIVITSGILKWFFDWGLYTWNSYIVNILNTSIRTLVKMKINKKFKKKVIFRVAVCQHRHR